MVALLGYKSNLYHLNCAIDVNSNVNLKFHKLYSSKTNKAMFEGKFNFIFEANRTNFINQHRALYLNGLKDCIVSRLYNRSDFLTYYLYGDNKLTFVSNKEYPLFGFRRKIAFLMDQINPSLNLIHGCGLKWNGSGILFVGESGSGKSTLFKTLVGEKKPSNYILDDDLILYSNDGRIYPSASKNIFEYNILEVGYNVSAKLKIVFVLNKNIEGGLCKKIDSQISRKRLIDNTIPKELRRYYLEKPDIIFNSATIYEIGTNQNKSKTMTVINGIIENECGINL